MSKVTDILGEFGTEVVDYLIEHKGEQPSKAELGAWAYPLVMETEQQILEWVAEVIGEDETFEKPTTKRRTYAEIARYARQGLRNEQRKRAGL